MYHIVLTCPTTMACKKVLLNGSAEERGLWLSSDFQLSLCDTKNQLELWLPESPHSNWLKLELTNYVFRVSLTQWIGESSYQWIRRKANWPRLSMVRSLHTCWCSIDVMICEMIISWVHS